MIKVENLDFCYGKSDLKALSALNFDIDKSEIFGFLGPSGSGKSTTQKILYRWLKGYSGNIEISGKKLQDWGSEYYEKIGVCFELPNHYNRLSAYENLKFFTGFYKKKGDINYWLEKVGLLEAAKKPMSEFSKGMRMRLNFVRAMLHDPEILFLDEPTSGLDPGFAAIIKNAILEAKNAGKTIFLTTHNMQDASELCDRVAFLNEGKIAALDKPDNLRHQFGKPMLKMQLRTEFGIENLEFPIEGLSSNSDFQKALDKPILSMHSAEASLEDVFIKLTGKKLGQHE